jgi:hypothetical protein
MHTSQIIKYLFFAAIGLALLGQVVMYVSTFLKRPYLSHIGFVLSLTAVIVSGIVGWQADTDWAHLPTSDAGLKSGQLWSDGGVIAKHP